MKKIYEKTYTFHAKPQHHDLLDMLQDAAGLHSIEMGASRDDLIRVHNSFWMIVRAYYKLYRPLTAGEIKVRTWHRWAKGILLYRDFDFWINGVYTGEGVQAWIIADCDTKKMLRLTDITLIEHDPGVPEAKDIQLSKLRAPAGEYKSSYYTVTGDDIDVNGHMNNVRYAYVVSQALGGADMTELQINYVNECFEGETLELHIYSDGSKVFVHGQDFAGNARFEASATLMTV